MKPFDRLLDDWDAGRLSEGDAADLKRQLSDPTGRAALVDDLLMHTAIYECIQESASETGPMLNFPTAASRSAASPGSGFRRLIGLAATVVFAAIAWTAIRAVLPDRSALGTLTPEDGAVFVTRAGGRGEIACTGPRIIHSGDSINTGPDSHARFELTDGSSLRLYHDTVATLSRSEAGFLLVIRRGAVDADIRHQPEGRPMQVTTEFMKSEILGTQFRLMVGEQSAWLGVREGRVEVTRLADGKTILLERNNYAAVHPHWPFMRMNPLECPYWKSVCQTAAQSPYP